VHPAWVSWIQASTNPVWPATWAVSRGVRYGDNLPPKIYGNLDFQRAGQGYLLSLPSMNQLANRAIILKTE
jgi:hypothetical protein